MAIGQRVQAARYILGSLLILLSFMSSAFSQPFGCQQAGQRCGGVTGFECCGDLLCDESREQCVQPGGPMCALEGQRCGPGEFDCCKGLNLFCDQRDRSGPKCKRSDTGQPPPQQCRTLGQNCGEAQNACCLGLACDIFGDFTCIKPAPTTCGKQGDRCGIGQNQCCQGEGLFCDLFGTARCEKVVAKGCSKLGERCSRGQNECCDNQGLFCDLFGTATCQLTGSTACGHEGARCGQGQNQCCQHENLYCDLFGSGQCKATGSDPNPPSPPNPDPPRSPQPPNLPPKLPPQPPTGPPAPPLPPPRQPIRGPGPIRPAPPLQPPSGSGPTVRPPCALAPAGREIPISSQLSMLWGFCAPKAEYYDQVLRRVEYPILNDGEGEAYVFSCQPQEGGARSKTPCLYDDSRENLYPYLAVRLPDLITQSSLKLGECVPRSAPICSQQVLPRGAHRWKYPLCRPSLGQSAPPTCDGSDLGLCTEPLLFNEQGGPSHAHSGMPSEATHLCLPPAPGRGDGNSSVQPISAPPINARAPNPPAKPAPVKHSPGNPAPVRQQPPINSVPAPVGPRNGGGGQSAQGPAGDSERKVFGVGGPRFARYVFDNQEEQTECAQNLRRNKECALGVRTGTVRVPSYTKTSEPSRCRCGKGDVQFLW
jgi:hypothetical protein